MFVYGKFARTKRLVIVACMIATVAAVGQHSQTGDKSAEISPSKQHGVDDLPSLTDTLSFMDGSVKPESSSISSVSNDSCEVYIVRNKLYKFAIPSGKVLLNGTDKFGIRHYGLEWIFLEETPHVIRFKLETIDPSSVNSKSVPSLQYLEEHDLDRHPEELKNADLTLVSFTTTNSTSTIRNGHFVASTEGPSPMFDHEVSMGFLIFESKDRAERFVTAFVHAAKLCGGKNSEFAPTPSTP